MLDLLNPLRDKLDELMIGCFNNRIILYGYGFTGKFLKWYAKYYHGIEMDYIIWENMPSDITYESDIYYQSLFSFDYKDVNESVLWMACPLTESRKQMLEGYGFSIEKNIIDFPGEVFGEDLYWPDSNANEVSPYRKRKTGEKCIQFLEWLEWEYGCNFLTAVHREAENGTIIPVYNLTTQKEIFDMLDHCHFHPSSEDAIFDYGFGKGGALVSFADYGFFKWGGVEYDKELAEVCFDNLQRLGLAGDNLKNLIIDDARCIEKDLDAYNWFYFFDPFGPEIFEKCIQNIAQSKDRKNRTINVISVYPKMHRVFLREGFTLVNQFKIDFRQKVVNIYRI